jgi:ATP-dependent helicase/DNAse subunit B
MRFISGQSSEAWTEFDGNIEQVDSDDRFKDTVGSATAFETYASCPYRYFLSRRLHVEPTESPEAGQTIDSLTFGTLIHDVLEQFAVWRMGWTGQTPLLNDQEDWLRAETASHIAKLRDETPSRSEGAWKIEQSRAWLILRQWLRREGDTAQQPRMRQVETEYSFGRTGAAPAVEVRTSTGKSVKFRGQVDRVDISDDGSQVIVYDYKSGGTSAYSKLDSDPVKKGTKLQLPLYSKAVAQKYPESDVRASYWFVREVGSSELTPQPEKYNQKIAESAFAAAVETIVEGIDQGNYPARPGDPVTYGEGGPTFENCLYCEYVRVCPKSKAHLWDLKKSSDPTLQGYVDLSEVDA